MPAQAVELDWTALAATGARAQEGPQLSLARGWQSKVPKFPSWNFPHPRTAPPPSPDKEMPWILASKDPVKGRKVDWAPGSQCRALMATVPSVMAPGRNPQPGMLALRRPVVALRRPAVALRRPAVALRRKAVALPRPVVAYRRPVYWRPLPRPAVETFGRVLAVDEDYRKWHSNEPCKARVRRHGAGLSHHQLVPTQ